MIRTRTARIGLALAVGCMAAAAVAPAAASAKSFTADVSNFVPYQLTPEDTTVQGGFFEGDLATIKPHSQSRASFVAKGTGSTSSLTGRVSYEAQGSEFTRPRGHVTIEFGVPFIGFDSADCYVDEGMKEAGIQCRVARAPSGNDPRVEFVVERIPQK